LKATDGQGAVRKLKAKTQYNCQNCGHSSPKWIGRCPSCQEWNTFVEERMSASEDVPRSWDSCLVPFDELTNIESHRLSTGSVEFDRVLGGGVVPGALILLGGDPGVGKSTLMLDVAARLSATTKVLYASGEESAQQIRMRGERMSIDAGSLHIYPEMSVEKILLAELLGRDVVIDSIQTTFTEKLKWLREVLARLRGGGAAAVLVQRNMFPVFLIGHVTRMGSCRRKRSSIVDTVYFEGPPAPASNRSYDQNRFGPANELGILKWQGPTRAVEKPSGSFSPDPKS
jgi:DNA repair protein RadA/Sms